MDQVGIFAGGGEMGALMRALDWSQTPLGAVEHWPSALRIAAGTVLGAPLPVCLFWGPEFLALYNDGYRRLIGDQHPAALGTASLRSLPELWSLTGPLLHEVLRTQAPVCREGPLAAFDRQGFPEEAWFSFSCSPLRDEHARGVGIWCFATETTRQVLAERRARLLRELASCTASARDAGQVLRAAGEVLARGALDVPFALLHRGEGRGARIDWSAGLEERDTPAPPPGSLAGVLEAKEARLLEGLGAGEGVRAGPWPEPVRRALLLPLCLLGGERPDAVLEVGLSPRLPLDEAYRDFLQLLARQLTVDMVRIRAEATHVRLANLLENAPAFVCTLRGPGHVFEFVNPLYHQLVGAGRPLLGLPVGEALPEAVAQGLVGLLDAVYRTGQPFVGRDFHALVDRQGTGQLEEIFVTFVYQPRRDPLGRVEGLDVFGFEVTDQVLARQRAESLAFLLRESEARQRRVVEASDTGLWELNLVSGRITLDERAASLFGLTSGVPRTLPAMLEFVQAGEREHLTRAIFAALSGEREGRFFEVFRTLGREGVPARWLECRGQRFQDAGGRPVALAGALLDITARKQAELERERLLKVVEAARGRLSSLVENAPAFVCILGGPRHVFEMINPHYRRLVGEGRRLLGLPVEEALPETVAQGFIRLLDEVYRTGVPALFDETPFLVDRRGDGQCEQLILNFIYQPRRDAHGQVEGIDVFGFEVTEQVLARRRAEALAGQLRESEERQRRMVEASGMGLWQVEGATGLLTADARMVELMGLPPGTRFEPEVVRECVHPQDREPVGRAISRALAGEDGGQYFMVFRTGGSEGAFARWVESRAQRLVSADGQRATLAGVMLDITERKETELLRARQARNLAVGARVGVALSRGNTVHGMLQDCAESLVTQLRAALVRIWLLAPTQDVLTLEASDGLSTELNGLQGRITLGEEPLGRIARERRPHLSNQLPEELQGEAREWARREKLVGFAGYPLRVGDKLVGVLALFSYEALPSDTLDVFAQVAASIALGVERLRAEEALRTRVDFEQKLMGIVSHDLRNPLNAILLGATVLAQREVLDARATRSLLRIQSSAERATRMVKDLLDFTQARLGGGLQITPHPANLHELTRAVVEEVEAAWPLRQVTLQHEGDGQGTWDADRLGQVVQNLVTNALKYSPEDSRVRVATRAEAGEVTLSVSNVGAPIPPDKLDRIFEPMQRATAEVDRVGRSVGLGLYIVKSIVQAHGGSIGVVSTAEAGITFTVRLPRHTRP